MDETNRRTAHYIKNLRSNGKYSFTDDELFYLAYGLQINSKDKEYKIENHEHYEHDKHEEHDDD